MDIEEIKEENLDSPLVVHKKDDASYQEANTEVSMQNTHVDEDSDMPTLERHRFKKEKKKKKWPYVLCTLIAILAVVLVVLFNNGTIKLPQKPNYRPNSKILYNPGCKSFC